jgi:catechol 2,3-dioxygenase-like lactoylglutathione lyase family enzyme
VTSTAHTNVTHSANNELALHVPDPSAAESFYTETLGCVVTERSPDCISLVNGALRLHLVRDPVRTHDAVHGVIFDVIQRRG